MSELKLCPFCGGNIQSYDEMHGGWQINCWCGAAGPDGKTPEEAAAAWNKRYYSEDAAVEAMRILDSLKEKLQKMRDNPENRRAE